VGGSGIEEKMCMLWLSVGGVDTVSVYDVCAVLQCSWLGRSGMGKLMFVNNVW
jgi:hypothetical protein